MPSPDNFTLVAIPRPFRKAVTECLARDFDIPAAHPSILKSLYQQLVQRAASTGRRAWTEVSSGSFYAKFKPIQVDAIDLAPMDYIIDPLAKIKFQDAVTAAFQLPRDRCENDLKQLKLKLMFGGVSVFQPPTTRAHTQSLFVLIRFFVVSRFCRRLTRGTKRHLAGPSTGFSFTSANRFTI